MSFKSIAKVNNVNILLVDENGEKRVAVKPICTAIGVSFQGQFEKIKNDPILSSTVKMILTVGEDQREREMFTIPFKFVFGWLFQIDSRKVKEESREIVLRYQLECYNVLYNYFTSYADYVEKKQVLIEAQLEIVEEAKRNFKNAKAVMDDANEKLKEARQYSYEDYDVETRQTKMNFEE